MPTKSFLYKYPKARSETDYHHKRNVIIACASIFQELKHHSEVVCCGQMQSGKTDCMKRIIYLVKKHGTSLASLGMHIYANRIFLILSASSIDLKKQLQEDLPEAASHIYHLNDIQHKLKNPVENEFTFEAMASSSLVIFDESHADATESKTIDLLRKQLDELSKVNKSDYKIVGFSATPYEQIAASYPKVILEPGDGYYGLKSMFNAWKTAGPVVFQAKHLEDPVQCADLFTEIDVVNAYYIIRLPSKKSTATLAMKNIQEQFQKHTLSLNTYIYDMNCRTNINLLLAVAPTRPFVIYLKDKLRMGDHLNTTHVYMVHDDPNNTHTHTTSQSLIGRCCGYNKQSDGTIIYCDYEKAWNHYRWIRSGYTKEKLPTHCKYVNADGETKETCMY